MWLKPFTRTDVCHHAVNALMERGELFLHEDGPKKGKPVSFKRMDAIISAYIREQKQKGVLIECRQYVDARSTRRAAVFFYVPQNLSLF